MICLQTYTYEGIGGYSEFAPVFTSLLKYHVGTSIRWLIPNSRARDVFN